LGSVLTTAPYNYSLDTTTLTNGPYTLTAVATDSTNVSTTSSPVSITVNNTPTSGNNVPFLTSTPSGTTRNDYGDFVGMAFTVGSSPLTVSQLGRWVVTGNSQTHIVKIVSANGVDLPGASVSLNLSGATAGKYAYASLPSNITLAAHTTYYLVTQEFVGGDLWYNYGPVTANSAAGVVTSAVYRSSGTYQVTNTPATSYGPPNFNFVTASQPPTVSITAPTGNTPVSGVITLTATATAANGLTIANVQFKFNGVNVGSPITTSPYTTTFDTTTVANSTYPLTAVATDSVGNSTTSAPVQVTVDNVASGSPSPFVTSGPPPTSLRNDFAGFVGMKFTVGSKSITVSSLGRWVAAASSQTHTIKLVSATGTDLTGGSVSLNLAGATVGQYAYALLPSPITLSANTSYYLVTQEFAGGDKWYDYGTVTANATAGAVITAVYQFNGVYFLTSTNSSSYGPPNFLFQ
jgi:Big-like domain-containing protein